jgi:hypothetical protein
MPYSYTTFDSWMGTFVELLAPKKVLDIGPGAGKHGKIVRQQAPNAMLLAQEIDASYVERFKLKDIYNHVSIGPAIGLIHKPDFRADLVILGDCIEHMRKSEAIDLLNFLVYRTSYIAIVTPEAFQQDDWEGHAAEAHISTWSPNDFYGWKTHHQFHDGMHLFVIQGFQPNAFHETFDTSWKWTR